MDTKTFTIKRIAETFNGLFGVMLDDNIPFAVTLENKWNYNINNISSIPRGVYFCKRVDSPKFGNTFEVIDVPNREHILFHYGNQDEDTEGCILIAEEFGVLNDEEAILSSNFAHRGFQEFLDRTADVDEFILSIQEFL